MAEATAPAEPAAAPEAEAAELRRLLASWQGLRDRDGISLDPLAGAMSPQAEAALSCGPRAAGAAQDGAAGEIAARAARTLFAARFAGPCLPSATVAGVCAVMACCRPGDAVVALPAATGGPGPGRAARLLGLRLHEAPADPETHGVDPAGLARLVGAVRPVLVVLPGRPGLVPQPVAEAARIARAAGARLLVEAGWAGAMIAGGRWPNPLAQGADLLSLGTGASLCGPPGGLVLTGDAELAARLDRVAAPWLAEEGDPGRDAALALTLLDWQVHGPTLAAEMVAAARTLAAELYRHGLPVFFAGDVATLGPHLALEAGGPGGARAMARQLARAGLLVRATGLPPDGAGGAGEGLWLGTAGIVRLGLTAEDMGELAGLLVAALAAPEPERLAPETARLRARFAGVRYTCGG